MKKKLIIVGITLILLCTGLSGCINEDKEQDNTSTGNDFDNFVGIWTVDGYNGITFFSNETLAYYYDNGMWELRDGKLQITVGSWNATVDYQFSNNHETITLTGLSGGSSSIVYTKQETIKDDTSDEDTTEYDISSDLGYVNVDFRFGLNPPEGWTVEETSPNVVSFTLGTAEGFSPTLVISQTPVEVNDSVSLYDLASGWPGLSPNLVVSERMVNGMNAYERTSDPYSYLSYSVQYIDVWVGNYEKIFSLAYHATGDLYDTYIAIIDESIDSFTIFQGQTSWDLINRLKGEWSFPPRGDNKLTYTFFSEEFDIYSSMEGYGISMRGTYEIEQGKLILTYTYPYEMDGWEETYNISFSNSDYTLTLTDAFRPDSEIILIKQ